MQRREPKPSLLPAVMPEEDRDEAELNSMKMKSERLAASLDKKRKEERDKMAVVAATGGKKKGKAQLKQEYRRGMMQKKAEVMDSDKFREHILSMSLFPNIHNKQMMMTNLDASM